VIAGGIVYVCSIVYKDLRWNYVLVQWLMLIVGRIAVVFSSL